MNIQPTYCHSLKRKKFFLCVPFSGSFISYQESLISYSNIAGIFKKYFPLAKFSLGIGLVQQRICNFVIVEYENSNEDLLTSVLQDLDGKDFLEITPENSTFASLREFFEEVKNIFN